MKQTDHQRSPATEAWKIVVAFAPEGDSTEDSNEAYGRIMDAFQDTGVEVRYSMKPKIVVGSEEDPLATLDISRFFEEYGAGYLAAMEGKEMFYLGDHGAFFDADESTDPIRAAREYFEKGQ